MVIIIKTYEFIYQIGTGRLLCIIPINHQDSIVVNYYNIDIPYIYLSEMPRVQWIY